MFAERFHCSVDVTQTSNFEVCISHSQPNPSCFLAAPFVGAGVKTMDRVLVHLVMLSTASAWKLSSGGEEAHDSTLSPHESAITGEADSARNRRRLASGCNADWSVSPPRPCFLSLAYNRAAAFLLAAYRRVRLLTVNKTIVTAATGAATIAAISWGRAATTHVIARATGFVHETSGC